MKVLKANVFSVVNFILGSGEQYGVAVMFLNEENNPYKLVIKADNGSSWTYDRDHIIVNESTATGFLLTVKRDASQKSFVNENGEDDIIEYAEKEYQLILTDLEQLKI